MNVWHHCEYNKNHLTILELIFCDMSHENYQKFLQLSNNNFACVVGIELRVDKPSLATVMFLVPSYL